MEFYLRLDRQKFRRIVIHACDDDRFLVTNSLLFDKGEEITLDATEVYGDIALAKLLMREGVSQETLSDSQDACIPRAIALLAASATSTAIWIVLGVTVFSITDWL